ncbi:hypothetical protein MRB53_027453 [Persea americana]|uniref:Uncharacterized protein n=1 Tax=Persea americana TaxID=3435 RepID=A0ACC2LL46_PERAE|nr:hypothetical protein MRB53_027453 [Persea americana]
MGLSILLILVSSFTALVPLEVEPKFISKIAVMGTVFCDTCSNNTFSKHSYFLPGVEVHLECKLKANSTADEDSFSVNRTTNNLQGKLA